MEKEVFILGAGFSKAIYYGMPLLKELTNEVTIQLRKDFNVFHKDETIDEKLVAHYNSIPSSITSNIESLLCYLSEDYPWKTDIQKNFDKALYEYLIIEVVKVIKSRWYSQEQNKVSSLKDFFLYIHSNNFPIITFNYDTIFESLYNYYCSCNKYVEYKKKISSNEERIYRINFYDKYSQILLENNKETLEEDGYFIEHSYSVNKNIVSRINVIDIESLLKDSYLALNLKDIQNIKKLMNTKATCNHLYKMPMNNVLERINKENIPGNNWQYEVPHLIKLHGSVNWYYNGKDLYYEGESISQGYNQNVKHFPRGGSGEVNPDYLKYYKSARYGLKPLIVPPVLNKNNYYSNDLLKDAWKQASEYLKEADIVTIIGYSIPETDIAVKYFLITNINAKCKINIVNYYDDTDENIEKIKENFKNRFSAFENLNLTYICNKEKDVFDKYIKESISTKKISFNKKERANPL